MSKSEQAPLVMFSVKLNFLLAVVTVSTVCQRQVAKVQ
jgi:hypothetical protein